MATVVQGTQSRFLHYGTVVTKAAQAFPQTATATLYTVTGGNILVTLLLGEVTTVVQSSDPVLTLGCGTPTIGGTLDTDGIATSTTLASQEVGTLVTVAASSGLGGALVVGSLAGSAAFLSTPFVVSAGTITWTTGASKTGAMKWYLTYIPLDDGASVS
jgi:hypothetical protein